MPSVLPKIPGLAPERLEEFLSAVDDLCRRKGFQLHACGCCDHISVYPYAGEAPTPSRSLRSDEACLESGLMFPRDAE